MNQGIYKGFRMQVLTYILKIEKNNKMNHIKENKVD